MKQITKQLLKSARYIKPFVDNDYDEQGYIYTTCTEDNNGKYMYIGIEARGKTREQAYRNFYRLIGKIEGGE